MALDEFLSVPAGGTRSLVVANRTEPELFQQMIETLFDEQDVSVEELSDECYEDNTVLLVADGSVVATSPLSTLRNAILMVNSDLYITGTRNLEATAVPDVIDGLTDVPFTLRGFPESNLEKLLLILISRHIERLAYSEADGTLRSSFQQLSRLRDERGTYDVYEQLANTAVDVHVYGSPDWNPTATLDVTMHGGTKWDFENAWFVLYLPPADASEQNAAALLAIETDDATWEGFWTYDQSLIDDIATYIRARL
jgi:hypothetical protein